MSMETEFKLDYKKSSGEKLVFHGDYHVMNDTGYWDGYYRFTFTVRPSLQFGVKTTITGAFGKYAFCRDDISDTLYWWITENIE